MRHRPYQLIDSGNQKKLERFGDYLFVRPCSQALWKPSLDSSFWKRADATFSREEKEGWTYQNKVADRWVVEWGGLLFQVAPTDFGHLGLFPEHAFFWKEMQELIRKKKSPPRILNLFAYSGGATLAAASAGAHVCHLDASKGMVAWARENATLNHLSSAPIRWIVDDVLKFLHRESKRGVRYEGIILDPPSFGRGGKGEVFKIEREIHLLLDLCIRLLSHDPLFLCFTTHTPGMTPIVMNHLLQQKMGTGVFSGEMILPSSNGLDIPMGSFAKWIYRNDHKPA